MGYQVHYSGSNGVLVIFGGISGSFRTFSADFRGVYGVRCVTVGPRGFNGVTSRGFSELSTTPEALQRCFLGLWRVSGALQEVQKGGFKGFFRKIQRISSRFRRHYMVVLRSSG